MKSIPDTDRIDAYRRQMLEMYRTATPSAPTIATDDNWLDDRYPEPNIERDKAVMEPLSPSPEPPPQPTAYVGYLRVFAFTAGGAEPIQGARVIVTRPEGGTQEIFANLTTDRDGFTPVIALPSVDPALTLQPSTEQPYVTYAVRVTADGFRPVEHRSIPVYGESYVTQPVALTPTRPGMDADTAQEFTSGGPTNL